MEIGFETMFMAQIFGKELSKMELEGPEKLALNIVMKYKHREVIEPVEKNYLMFTIWRNREGFLNILSMKLKRKIIF